MAERPNIVLFFTDQQRYDSVACSHGDPRVRESLHTPNLDRLCSEGARFDRAYTPNPVCIPARHNMMTGLPARYHGHAANSGNPCPRELPVLPQLLSDAGYLTHAVGKMHFRPMRRHHGFDRMELMEETPRYREDDDYLMYLKSVGCNVLHQHGVRHLLYHQPQRSLVPEEHHGSRWVADRSIEFLRRAAAEDRPFFLKSSWIAPHPPENVPERLADLYAGAALPGRIPRLEPPDDRSDLVPMARNRFELGEGMLDDPPRLRRHREHYHVSISFVDEQMGRILDCLDELGLASNTLLLFASDHGEMLGDLDCFQKSLPYESACRIPFIMRFPGVIEPGSVDSEHFVDLNDVLPTFLDAAGVNYPGPLELPGASLLDAGSGRDRSVQYIENGNGPKRWCSLRDAKYKYVYSYYGGHEALFDMVQDPFEQRNLLTEGVPADLRPVYDHMRRRLVDYEERWGLAGMIEWKDFLRLQPYALPAGPKARNSQYPPPWILTLPPEELAGLRHPTEEIIDAVRDEPLVRLSELDLEGWARRVGLDGDFVERVRRGNP
ncbi:MAG: sulfatase-like hydrolase/transferase [Planctomycetes bacterium]|nr:sulfatase-like hydrolase/transferase [Planctomycetota bacterium]